uniref:Ammonium_transp domain-containing protein n=1 Tax=Rhabditophanes sp. KR3021 TaxID=114890 RepID=A0AC35UIM6_9BILA
MAYTKPSAFQHNQFVILLGVLHVIFIVIFGLFARYSESAQPSGVANQEMSDFPLFEDIHGMIFIGFGFLMTFLRRYGFSAISINLFLATFVIEWAIIIRGFLSEEFHEHGIFSIGIKNMITADFAAAVILITMGGLLGKLSPSQYLIMAFLETPVALVTEHIIVEVLHVSDVGGSLVVHLFGAVFAFGVAKVLNRSGIARSDHEGSIVHSDLFAMVGSLILFIYWPSFNAAVAVGDNAKQRCILNTYLSLSGAVLGTFITSQLVNHKRHFDMVHMANAILAGGVAIGSVANISLHPVLALIIGTFSGIISVMCINWLTPFMKNKLGIHDTCSINSLHGVPAFISGICSVILALVYTKEQFGAEYAYIYPASVGDHPRSNTDQALYQALAILIAIVVPSVAGLVTGVILKLKIWNQVADEELFADGAYFHCPNDYDFTTKTISHIDHIEITEEVKIAA